MIPYTVFAAGVNQSCFCIAKSQLLPPPTTKTPCTVFATGINRFYFCQESTANVEEWKRQLHAYKEENTRLKVGLIELEAGRGNC